MTVDVVDGLPTDIVETESINVRSTALALSCQQLSRKQVGKNTKQMIAVFPVAYRNRPVSELYHKQTSYSTVPAHFGFLMQRSQSEAEFGL